ncbi:MAG: FixH family protein [Rhizobiales bacterium]|nr:FixH family protein [Hyphomicrobiales bacterium]
MPVDLPERVAPPVPRAEFRLTGWHVLAMLLTFFAIVAGVNGYMLRQALTTMPGLDAGRNGYDVSQNFNRDEFAAANAQVQRNWQSDARLQLSGGVLTLALTFRDRQGQALNNLAVTALLAHPAARRLDRAIALIPRGDGRYEARVPQVDAGAWGLVIEARAADAENRLFLSRHRVILRDEGR